MRSRSAPRCRKRTTHIRTLVQTTTDTAALSSTSLATRHRQSQRLCRRVRVAPRERQPVGREHHVIDRSPALDQRVPSRHRATRSRRGRTHRFRARFLPERSRPSTHQRPRPRQSRNLERSERPRGAPRRKPRSIRPMLRAPGALSRIADNVCSDSANRFTTASSPRPFSGSVTSPSFRCQPRSRSNHEAFV